MTFPLEIPRTWLLPVIVIAQFAGTSLWFSGNAVLPDLQRHLDLGPHALGMITSSVQLGFIAGTFFFALFAVTDYFSPRIVFLVCSLGGAVSNLMICIAAGGLSPLLTLRFLTGVFLAGIYPVGMKIAASWYPKGLGGALGYLIGALVLGTAFPHLLKSLGQTAPFQPVIIATSAAATAGGFLLWSLVPDGPHLPTRTPFRIGALPRIFRTPTLRAAAMGYFGHMWEVYTFWAFVPVLLAIYGSRHPGAEISISGWSFTVIAAGSVGCVLGGMLSKRVSSARVAAWQLGISGGCCLLSPLLFFSPFPVCIGVLFIWGVTVAGDSPQFSAIVAGTAPKELVGSALTIVNCIGFSITIASIHAVEALADLLPEQYLLMPLVLGPMIGLTAMRPLWRGTAR